MYAFRNNSLKHVTRKSAFTIVEVAAALAVLSVMLTSVMVLINRYAEAVMDMQLREQAFEIARGNMETLLTESRLSDVSEYGTSEIYPDIEWETIVEPFYEPITNRMWIRAICSAGFEDATGEYESIELEHWITNLTGAQIKQIVAQQQAEEEYLSLINDEEDSAIEETTLAYLEEQGINPEPYQRFLAQQKREKIEYINKNGFDGYDRFVEKLEEEENAFLEKQGMDFDGYNSFAAVYVPRANRSSADASLADAVNDSQPSVDSDPSQETDSPNKPDTTDDTNNNTDNDNDTSSDDLIDWDAIPREFWPLFESLGLKPPK